MSALGKGVTSASISMLLKKHGYSVCPIKCENNLNVDFGTINPIEHGDPFLCFDGCESDIDLGNYERFLEQEVGYDNFITMGQLYLKVISDERQMKYNGEDVEPNPDVVNEIIRRYMAAAEHSKADFIVIELGGTVGEYENNNGLYYEAARRLAKKLPVAHVHVTYVPVPPHVGEPKTKPAQFGIKALMTMGIYPDFLVIRSEIPIDDQRKYKFSHKFDILKEDIFSNENLDTADRVPLRLHEQGLDLRILKFFDMKAKPKLNLRKWENYVNTLKSKMKNKTKIAIVGKYFSTGNSQLIDSYYALVKSIEHASVFNDTEVELLFVNSEKEAGKMDFALKDADGIVVPIGWGSRGVEGKIEAVKFARENKVPYLGLCYGMQLACVEYARDVLGLKDANSVEVNPDTKNPIIYEIPFDPKYQTIKGDGCSMRLGTFDCKLKKCSLAYEVYEKHKKFEKGKPGLVRERHRHRYEFNNAYRERLEKAGLVVSGTSPDNFFVEFIELPKDKHPFFIATQGHPEYKSRPLDPHPLFIEFLKASLLE
ncbi:CTP synthase [candidate division WWE3 bacterium CG_4_9_14_0_2_um_filter_35_11]|uniref:CTP synthase (glutamine hydrolyzing) n=1 Tax=candidate division WWE3 bacterium CG_4_9_14_0_2_um_filter_35_11 TaxID=1975077 RepID=A0A2M8EKR9_UNCKA|nr:MAG: CTP synthetase [candidate division WWE3 bacterium CG10_big_fil_rev_8_21_14_0_10_35_32]PJC23315.1 MAG: CTP synthase [candidate division WWE3 bacterium CG_4_9_14_0_2_um_filter_35_11]